MFDLETVVSYCPDASFLAMSVRAVRYAKVRGDKYNKFTPSLHVSFRTATGADVVAVHKPRGVITNFSSRSRSRMLKMISQVRHDAVPLFVTLTYHNKYSHDVSMAKKHLDIFSKRLLRRFPSAGYIWRLEFQKRGAPHFHLVLFNISLNDAQSFIPQAWNDIVDYGNDEHLNWHKGLYGNSHCVEAIRSHRGLKSYASKYMAKLELDFLSNNIGRVWGVRGLVPFSKIISFRMSLDDALAFRKSLVELSLLSNGHISPLIVSRLGFWVFFDGDISSITLPFVAPESPPDDWSFLSPPPLDEITLTC